MDGVYLFSKMHFTESVYMAGAVMPVLYALVATMITFLLTSFGACSVFFVRKNIRQNVQCLFLGFAGGVMIAAAIWSLLIPGIEAAQAQKQIGWFVAAGGFLLGVLVLLFVDYFMRKKMQKFRLRTKEQNLSKSTFMLILAITIHNIPEGMAVGMAFALAGSHPSDANLMSGAIALAVGIGIQNYPEGMAVALPLLKEGISKKRAFLYGTLSAAVEPLFGVIAAIIAGMVQSVMPLLLAFAAGTMIYVVVEELIPEAHLGEKENVGTLGFVVGFLIMMILDVALG